MDRICQIGDFFVRSASLDEQKQKIAKLANSNMTMEPLAGVEPVTCSLRMSCSTN